MSGFAAGHASGEDWRECVNECLAELEWSPGSSLGFVYWTDQLTSYLPDILATLREYTGIADWVGTVAMGICGNSGVHVDEPALSVMIGEFPADSFRVFTPIKNSGMCDLDEATKDWIVARSSYLALVHADQHSRSLDQSINSLVNFMEGGFLIGGVGSARGRCPQVAGGVVQGGLSGVLFSENVAVSTRLSQGCSPIGPCRTVTSGRSNIILAIDNRPALEVFKEDIGEVLARDLRRVAGYIFAGFSVPGSDTGEYLVRNLVGVDQNSGALAVGEYVKPGDRMMFCRRDPQTAVDDMERMLKELTRSLNGQKPKGGIYISCLARGPNQFEPPDLEIILIRRYLGEFPLTGFFANGEISHDRLYAYTGVLTLFL
ncbi:MAG: histidine kinase [Gammaproteobacteria bacterium]|nr:histidine kinase [Gammaproteobacteria bacterium]